MEITIASFLLFSLFLLSFLFTFKPKTKQYLKHPFPPGPKPLPLIGNLLQLGPTSQPHVSFTSLSKTYGPILSLKLGQVTTIVISSKEHAKQVFQNHDLALAARHVPAALHVRNHPEWSVAWLAPGPRWRSLRRVCAMELFTKERLDEYGYLRRQKVQELMDFISQSSKQDLFVAGNDTSSSTVEWAMAELLNDPISMKRVRAELASVIGSKREMEESDINQLPFLNAVVKETFRLHPPVPFLLPRHAQENVELDGFTIPQGSQVLINVWAIGRDATTWQDPHKFNPERFLKTEIDFKGRDFELIPFGAGRRICPGLPLAYRLVHLVLGSMLHRFEWKLPEENMIKGIDMSEKFGVTLSMASHLKAIALPVQVDNLLPNII